MTQPTISAELVRQLRHRAPDNVIDHRDPKLPGFVLRARPSGVHSWRVQLTSRRWPPVAALFHSPQILRVPVTPRRL
jgi:hypothetical protein